ncbi:hypothetical protein [Amycolatopsis japonica]|uniref:hypothetical protein n=1 Tax=Amycolatopsis japonica TaxID=208439 RepID=UPI0011DD51F8|nr:hypothetical protein [Amycolatopsis japonica]
MKESRQAIAVLTIASSLMIVIASCKSYDATAPSQLPISQAQAEGLLNQAIDLVQANNYDGLCQVVAAAEQNCRIQLEGAVRSKQQPGSDRPKVVGFSVHSEQSGSTAVLRLEGSRADGVAYVSDFAVIRTEGSKLGSLTAPYWVGIKYIGGDQSPSTTSTSSSGN